MIQIYYEQGPDGFYYPTLHKPDEGAPRQWDLPEESKDDFGRMLTVTESKYTKEYLKMCAYYNKLFPTLRHSTALAPSHNSLPFTITDQESTDVGSGLSANYLKTITETIVSRLGVKLFDYKLIMETPSLVYTLYKDEVERVFRAMVRKQNLQKTAVAIFHNASILGFSHLFMDPFTHELRKISDYELGCYESEFAKHKLKRVVIRDFDFPVSELRPYLNGFDAKDIEGIIKRKAVDFKIFIDCYAHKVYAIVDSIVGPPQDYPFEHAMIESYSWDLGVKDSHVSCLFDLLYPLQRAIDKFLAKESQLILNYKGPIPVFNKDVDLVIKNIGNGAGEALFLSNPIIDPSLLVTTIEPTPLDANLDSQIEGWKQKMYELAGVQQVSLDIEQYRSAAAMIALEQMRDAQFQPQLQGIAEFLQRAIRMYVKYTATLDMHPDVSTVVSWKEVDRLLEEAVLDVKPVHNTNITGGQDGTSLTNIDYKLMNADRFIVRIVRGELGFDDIDYTINYDMVKALAAVKLLQLRCLQEDAAESIGRLEEFLFKCFVEDIRLGTVNLNG